jgi:hypothetical protein
LDAFYFLSPSRSLHLGGEGPIPISEILAYLEVMEIPSAERPEYLRFIREMDNAYLDHRHKKQDSSKD